MKAHIKLCRKLHLPGIDVGAIEKVIVEYIAMYDGPLPEQVVAALSTMFGLDDDYMDSIGDALLELVGQEVVDLQAEVQQGDRA